MFSAHHKSDAGLRGFTLVELMIVIGILSILASIAVPAYQRARRRTQATHIVQDLRAIDSAIDQYALEYNKNGGSSVVFTDLTPYFKAGSLLRTTGADLFGNPYGPYSVDHVPQVNTSAYNALSDVTDPSFWSPFH